MGLTVFFPQHHHVFDVEPDQLTGYFRVGFSREPRRGHRHIGFRCTKDVG